MAANTKVPTIPSIRTEALIVRFMGFSPNHTFGIRKGVCLSVDRNYKALVKIFPQQTSYLRSETVCPRTGSLSYPSLSLKLILRRDLQAEVVGRARRLAAGAQRAGFD